MIQKPIAFFDIDGTVFRSSLLIELVNACIDEGVFPSETVKKYSKEYRAWRDREGTYDAYICAVIEAFIEHLRGVHYGDFARIGRYVVETHGKMTYEYTRTLIQSLREEGYYLVAISQSPKTILDEFCASYGFDKVYGRIYEIGPQDRFTGEVTDEGFIKNKANVVDRVFEKGGFKKEGSIAVGDTEGDIPLLLAVERPICFNPNKKLYEFGKEKGWEIIVERKDVVYYL